MRIVLYMGQGDFGLVEGSQESSCTELVLDVGDRGWGRVPCVGERIWLTDEAEEVTEVHFNLATGATEIFLELGPGKGSGERIQELLALGFRPRQ